MPHTSPHIFEVAAESIVPPIRIIILFGNRNKMASSYQHNGRRKGIWRFEIFFILSDFVDIFS